MKINGDNRRIIEDIIRNSLRKKFENYNPETSQMPFHYRLLGKDRMALFSFIQSLNTTFGTSIFEPVAETIATKYHTKAEKQFVVGDKICEYAQQEIQEIMNDLSSAESKPDKKNEIERIRKVCQKGRIKSIKTVKVDLCIEDKNGILHFFDIKTAKPNKSNFKDFKRTLLEWIAIYLAQNPKANVGSYIAIPYNPYEPEPYERWTMAGMLDLNNELKVADELWDYLGEKGTYSELLDCFEKVGIEMRPEIDKYFSKFK